MVHRTLIGKRFYSKQKAHFVAGLSRYFEGICPASPTFTNLWHVSTTKDVFARRLTQYWKEFVEITYLNLDFQNNTIVLTE